ncbi:hypothetical protein H311_00638 [Anncaliia algerae PRA109]|nr:hypothetical protein H311_00638 [Anncaliia algerae PRA109]
MNNFTKEKIEQVEEINTKEKRNISSIKNMLKKVKLSNKKLKHLSFCREWKILNKLLKRMTKREKQSKQIMNKNTTIYKSYEYTESKEYYFDISEIEFTDKEKVNIYKLLKEYFKENISYKCINDYPIPHEVIEFRKYNNLKYYSLTKETPKENKKIIYNYHIPVNYDKLNEFYNK